MANTLTRYIQSFLGAGDMTVRQYFKNIIIRFKEDSLFQNSVYLMTSTFAMSLFGFAFWIITTRLYAPDQIGFATALISATILLSSFSLFGFNTGLVRFLPKSDKPNRLINSAIVVVALITVIISIGYVLGIGYIAPQFSLLKTMPAYGAAFVLVIVMVSVNMLTDSVFIAYRASKYNFIEYLFFGLAKIILPILLVAYGTYGIFFSYTGSVIVALMVTFYFFYKKFNYKASIIVEKDVIKQIGGFSIGNYIATFLSGLPLLMLPTIIVAKLGPSSSAYFYIASTIASLLYGLPQAMSQSLLAEGSHNENEMNSFVVSASKLIGVILVIGVAAFVVLGKWVLMIFGRAYAMHSYHLLNIMAFTSFFIGINIIYSTILRVQNRIQRLVWISVGYVIATIVFVYFLLHDGIIGAGWALLLGQAFMSIEFFFLDFL